MLEAPKNRSNRQRWLTIIIIIIIFFFKRHGIKKDHKSQAERESRTLEQLGYSSFKGNDSPRKTIHVQRRDSRIKEYSWKTHDFSNVTL